MANYRKSFNLRNGVQVDDDNFIVNANGLVGIGTSVPTEFLDVRGNAKIVGLVTATSVTVTNLLASGVTTFTTLANGRIIINSGIITASSGIVTYYGDGQGLINIPSSQWIDANPGSGFSSIYYSGTVGIATSSSNYYLQIGGDPASGSGTGINSTGSIRASGIITAASFVGSGTQITQINASNIASGTLSNSRLPSNINISGIVTATGGFIGSVSGNLYGDLVGNVTGNLVGNVTGIASTARTLTGNPDISVNNITATSIASTSISVSSIGCTNIFNTGIVTSSSFNIGLGGTILSLTTSGNIGIGSNVPTKDIQVLRSGTAAFEIIGSSESQIIIGQKKTPSIGVGDSTAVIRFGNSSRTFDLINGDQGDFNFYLHTTPPVAGIETGSFRWLHGQNISAPLMTLTYGGRLGIGRTNPSNTLHVVGTSTVTSNAFVGGNLTVYGTLTASSIQLPSVIQQSNIYVTSGISTFNYIKAIRIGINSDSPTVAIDAKDSTALLSSIGIGTISTGASKLKVVDGFAEFNSIGIGTTQLFDPGEKLQLHNTGISIFNGSILIDNANGSTIGFGTNSARAIVDFGNVGLSSFTLLKAYMILPSITNSQRVGLLTTSGGIIYNSSSQEFQGYTNDTWINLGITTANINSNQINVSGISTLGSTTKIGTGVTIQSGIVTSINGFNSGIGTAVQITTVGNTLVFTVPGVGTTTLTLF